MTKEEVKTRLLTCLSVDESDYDEVGTIGQFFDELDEPKDLIGDEFDIDVDSLDFETTFGEMIEVLHAHLNP